MIDEIKNIKCEKSELRNFGLSIGIILLIVAGYILYKEQGSFDILIYVSIFLISLGLGLPIILKPFYLIWMVFATILGWFMSRLILTLLFYTIITPMSLVLKILGKQFLENKNIDSKNSLWNNLVNDQSKIDNYTKQF